MDSELDAVVARARKAALESQARLHEAVYNGMDQLYHELLAKPGFRPDLLSLVAPWTNPAHIHRFEDVFEYAEAAQALCARLALEEGPVSGAMH